MIGRVMKKAFKLNMLFTISGLCSSGYAKTEIGEVKKSIKEDPRWA